MPRRRRSRKGPSRIRRLLLWAAVVFAGCLVLSHVVGERAVTDKEALARVIRSEAGTSSRQHRLHVAWATRNLADSRRRGIAEMFCSPCGPQMRGREVSTLQGPRPDDLALAEAVLAADPILDPTGGARHFINPALQDKLARQGRRGYRGRPYRIVRRHWIRKFGWRPYYRLDDTLELWGPER